MEARAPGMGRGSAPAGPDPSPSDSARDSRTRQLQTIASGVRVCGLGLRRHRTRAPALHVRQGDTVEFTLVNRANILHSTAISTRRNIAPSKYYVNVRPGELSSLITGFVARVPGGVPVSLRQRWWPCTSVKTGCTVRSWSTGEAVPEGRGALFFVQSEFDMTTQPRPTRRLPQLGLGV